MKDFNELFSSGNPNQMTAQLAEEMTRTELENFLKLFGKDYYELIDFSKGYEIMDEATPYFVPEHYANDKNAFDLLVKATSKKGETIYFLIHTIFELEKGNIRVGFADIHASSINLYEKMTAFFSKYKNAADEEDDDDDDEEYDDFDDDEAEEEPEPAEKGELKHEYVGANQCSNCGRTDLSLTITFNASTMKRLQMCTVCLHNVGPGGVSKRKESLKELDESIATYEDLSQKYESLIKEMPEMPELPDVLEKYAMTPMSAYKSIQAMLAELKSKRMKLMTEMDSEVRLNYELKKSLAQEDYEKSAEIRDKLNTKKEEK